jgi:penicillin-binding protein 1A
MKLMLRFVSTLFAALFAAFFLALSALAALYLSLVQQLPSVQTLKDVRFQVPMRIYGSGGELIAEFGEQRRIPVKLEQVPDLMVKAMLAAEDDRFYHHPGVDYQGILRAALHLLKTGEKTQGGSTITMQVARNFFLGSEKTYARKLNEVLLALKIERELSKDEILELYLNQIYLGNRAYGVAAAAHTYYGKSLGDLTLGEIAMIAGLPKAPSRDNPIADPERAVTRREYVLGRMEDLGYITADAHERAMNEPPPLHPHSLAVELAAPYVAEMVRADMVQRYGEGAYTEGFEVFTTTDARLQRAADTALRSALFEYDARHGYRGAVRHTAVPARPEEREALVRSLPASGGLLPALAVRVGPKGGELHVAGHGTVQVPWEGLSWARRYINENRRGPVARKASDVLSAGDLVYVESLPEEKWRLAQIPQVEGALVALSPQDGAIQALAGGFDFFRSRFNRVTQAQRQPGSSFKPFIYSAALEKGFTPASLINDVPVVIEGGDHELSWHPENYSGKFYGPTRLREALVHSRNLVSVRLLRSIGIDYTIGYLSRFGFDPQQLPRGLSLALGSAVLTPLQLTAGYTVFANGGYRIKPYYIQRIRNLKGEIVWQAPPAGLCSDCPERGLILERAVSAQNAYLINSMMTDVIRRGTGSEARSLGRQDLAGKTGTTNDWHDAWFAGFNSALLATAWVGFDQPRSLGEGETGARAALPMWIHFMAEALKGVPDKPSEQPPGLITARIDPGSGLLARPGQAGTILEIFRDGYVPRKMVAQTSNDSEPSLDDTGSPREALTIPEQLF